MCSRLCDFQWNLKERINCGESDVDILKEEHEARLLFFFITSTNLKLLLGPFQVNLISMRRYNNIKYTTSQRLGHYFSLNGIHTTVLQIHTEDMKYMKQDIWKQIKYL